MHLIRKHRSLLSWSLLILCTAWIAGTALWFPVPGQAAIQVPRQGFLAPDFELNTLTGGKIHLRQLAGKPVIINFWASWCPPCKSEIPAIQKVWEHFQAKGIMILAVNATYQDSYETALAILIAVILWPWAKFYSWENSPIFSTPGIRFLSFTVFSTAAYIFLETFRGDSSVITGNIRTTQVIAWLFLAIALRFINLRYPKDEGSN